MVSDIHKDKKCVTECTHI